MDHVTKLTAPRSRSRDSCRPGMEGDNSDLKSRGRADLLGVMNKDFHHLGLSNFVHAQ